MSSPDKYEKCQPSGIDVIPTCLFYGDAFKFHKVATADGLETILRLSDGRGCPLTADATVLLVVFSCCAPKTIRAIELLINAIILLRHIVYKLYVAVLLRNKTKHNGRKQPE